MDIDVGTLNIWNDDGKTPVNNVASDKDVKNDNLF
jgi:hypothetical protein